MKPVSQVRREFDAIARASAQRPDPAGLYDDEILSHVPAGCRRALDIGCGTGRFTRRLAERVPHVTAIDLSEVTLDTARARSRGASIEYLAADALTLLPRLGRFDCVVSLATFHHLPQDEGAACFAAAVAPGGTLILQDLWRVDGLADRALDAVRLPVKLARLLAARSPVRHTREEREAWRVHARGDEHLMMREVRALRDQYFSGATVTPHFLWRYTLVWRAPLG
jgi:SAM-dependent methyltransferase